MPNTNFLIDGSKVVPNVPVDQLIKVLKADELRATARMNRLQREVTTLRLRYNEQRTQLLGSITITVTSPKTKP